MLYSANAVAAGSASTTAAYMPSLYIGSDGKLIGRFSNVYSGEVVTSANAVNDGRWHFVVLSASTSSQTMYLDGTAVGTNAGTLTNSGATSYVYLGTGYLGGSWPDESHQSSTNSTGYASYFTGSMAEFAAFNSQLSAAQVADQWAAAKSSQGLTPVQTAQVTDPGGKTLNWSYDPLNGDRLIAQTDGDGATTRYGYDTNGFLSTVTDPDGDVTSYGYDVRGNMVSQTTCQNRAADDCSTSYYTYYPDDTTEAPAADPRNDMMTASLDPRSSSATDTRYKTSYGYNSFGELTSVTGPPVPGYPSGTTTNIVYSCNWDGTQGIPEPGTTCVNAVNSNPNQGELYPPGGLPYTTTTPGGAVTTYLYYLDGDVAQVTSPDGQVTKYTYDGLGRMTATTVISNSYPNGLTTTFAYAPDGEVTTETDPAVTDRVTGAVHTTQASTTYDATATCCPRRWPTPPGATRRGPSRSPTTPTISWRPRRTGTGTSPSTPTTPTATWPRRPTRRATSPTTPTTPRGSCLPSRCRTTPATRPARHRPRRWSSRRGPTTRSAGWRRSPTRWAG